MQFKKSLLCLAATVLVGGSLTSCGRKVQEFTPEVNVKKIAMITDSGNVDDKSFNETTHDACKSWVNSQPKDADGNAVWSFDYKKPNGDSTEQRVASIENAIDQGYGTIVMPGYLFAGAIDEVAYWKHYQGVNFIALDVSLGDLLEAHYGSDYDYNPDNEKWTAYKGEDFPSNLYCTTFSEEIAGFFAGVAAVADQNIKLGFCGGMAVPAVQRYGYGFLQGCQYAVEHSDGAVPSVDVNYGYAGTFGPDAKIQTKMKEWYDGGTQCVFSCGGGIFNSVAAAATGKKMVGVDSDQKATIEALYSGVTVVTSAMKGLEPAVQTQLEAIKAGTFSSKLDNLGLVEAGDSDPTKNYVQLPSTTLWNERFDEDDYKSLAADIRKGTVTISNDISKKPTEIVDQTKVKVTALTDNIVG